MAVRPLQPLAQWTLVTASAAQTYQLGMVLGRHPRAGQLIALQGDLGAGKTTLTQGIAAGMGLSARASPAPPSLWSTSMLARMRAACA